MSVKNNPPKIGVKVLVTWQLTNEEWAEPEKAWRFYKLAAPNKGKAVWSTGITPDLWQPLPELPTRRIEQ